jgi:hypothetical protein
VEALCRYPPPSTVLCRTSGRASRGRWIGRGRLSRIKTNWALSHSTLPRSDHCLSWPAAYLASVPQVGSIQLSRWTGVQRSGEAVVVRIWLTAHIVFPTFLDWLSPGGIYSILSLLLHSARCLPWLTESATKCTTTSGAFRSSAGGGNMSWCSQGRRWV